MVCPQHIVQHHSCKNNVSDYLRHFLHGAQQYPKSAHYYPKRVLNHHPASADHVVSYFFFPCELSSAVDFHHPWHQGKCVIAQEEIVQIWPSLPSSSGGRSPKVPLLIFSLKSLLLKKRASDEDPLDPTLTQRNLYSVLTRASSTREKKPSNCNGHCLISLASS